MVLFLPLCQILNFLFLLTYIHINLISADTWEKYYYKLLVGDRKEFLGKKEKSLEKGIGNITEIDSNTVKHAIMRMKTGRAADPGDIPIELIKSRGQKLLEMITILFIRL